MDLLSNEGVFTFTWRIENFSMCPQKKGEQLKSPVFVVDALGKTTWYLKLYPRGDDSSDGKWMSCFLMRAQREEEPAEVNVSYYIEYITPNTESYKLSLYNHTIKKDKGCGHSRFINLKSLSESNNLLLSNDVLTVLCAMRRGTDASKNEVEEVDVAVPIDYNSYSPEEISTLTIDNNDTAKHRLDSCVVSTLIPVERNQITYIIKDFKTQMLTLKKIPLSVESRLRQKSRLLLHCYLSGDWISDGSVRINIQRNDGYFQRMLVRCKVSVLDINDSVQVTQEDQHLFGEYYEVWSFPPLIKTNIILNRESEFLKDGTLKLRCEFLISYTGGDITKGFRTYKTIDTDDFRDVINDLLDGKELTDVTLASGDLELPVHKSVICARSPVFRAMFTHDTEEKRTGVVRIHDTDADTLRKMVDFIYWRDTPDLQLEEAVKLYSAADKYEILKLKKQCAAFLKCNLSLTNMCDILVLADLHQDSDILKFVRNFMRVHRKEAFESNEWSNLMKDNHQLARVTMQEVLMLD